MSARPSNFSTDLDKLWKLTKADHSYTLDVPRTAHKIPELVFPPSAFTVTVSNFKPDFFEICFYQPGCFVRIYQYGLNYSVDHLDQGVHKSNVLMQLQLSNIWSKSILVLPHFVNFSFGSNFSFFLVRVFLWKKKMWFK